MAGMDRRSFLASSAAAASAAPRPAGYPVEYPIYLAAGSHRELGRQHGEQASAKIKAHLDFMKSSGGLGGESLERRALQFEPLFETHCPHLLDEIRGLAEGAGVTFAEAMAVNIRGEIASARNEGCTAYAVQQREILIGQNSDITAEIPAFAYVLHLKPRGKPEVLIWTFGGMVGYHGINSEGVAHFANALGGGPAPRFAMPHYPVKRMMLECANRNQAADLLRRIPLASNGNYVMCDTRGILDVEATTEGPEVPGDSGRGYIVHTNHFVCSRYAKKENFDKSWQDSFPRLDRMNALLESKKGAVAVSDLKRFLSDHSGKPASICRHHRESCTVASIIAEPGRRRMHVAAGNPCESRYAVYTM
jgi:isopenicillin-N N-acyltransferase-like protein